MKKIKYENGIKFQCQESSNCCVSRGSHGFVFLSKKIYKRDFIFKNRSGN